MKREDDGSQQWLDEYTHARLRGVRPNMPQQRSNYQELDPNAVADPVLRERLLLAQKAGLEARDRYTKTWHAGPAHLGGKVLDPYAARDFVVDVDVNGIERAIENKHVQQRQILGEVDSAEAQLQRIPAHLRNRSVQVLNELQHQRSAFPQYSLARLNEVGNANFQQPQQQQTGPQACRLMEGHPCFRPLQTGGYGSNVVLARSVGQIVPQIAIQEFVVKGYVNVYIVPPHQTAVDLNAIQRNPQLCVQLVEVIAPPASGLGTLLVQKEALAIATNNPYGQQRGIITDSRARQTPPNQQILLNRPAQQQQQPTRTIGGGRTLLRG